MNESEFGRVDEVVVFGSAEGRSLGTEGSLCVLRWREGDVTTHRALMRFWTGGSP